MSRLGGRALLAKALALGLAACDSPAANNVEKPAPPASQVAVVGPRAQATGSAPQPGVAPAAGSAQVNTLAEMPVGARFAVPQVVLPNVAASRRINKVIAQLLLTDFLEDSTHLLTTAQAIKRAVAEYKANSQIGVFGTSFHVLYNQQSVLSLALTTEYSGAYPSSATRYATFDLRTGRRLALADLLADTLALRHRWHARINARLATYQKEIAQEYKADADAWATVRDYTGWSDTLRQVRPARRPLLREFAVTKQGLVLHTSFAFPHAVLALEPPDTYVFTYASLQPWLSSSSLLQGLR